MANKIPRMTWDTVNPSEAFRMFKQRMELYFTLKNLKEEEKVATVLLAVGEEVSPGTTAGHYMLSNAF